MTHKARHIIPPVSLVLALALIFGFSSAFAQRTASTREFFYVGGKYSGGSANQIMTGQMYVEVLTPQRVTQKDPLVFFHGNNQTATNWMGTPDGRAGWADYFLAQGYRIYVVDQPARGRSPWHGATNGPVAGSPTSVVEQRFTAPEVAKLWPQAKTHTQWPGDGERKGLAGDPIFDAFYATQVESLTSGVETQTLVQGAGAALLDKIGRAIVVTHSQAGSFGWLLADARPQLVRGIVAIEPSGPPFQNAVFEEGKARPWGLTDIPLTYDPPLTQAGDLKVVRERTPDEPDLVTCSVQADPPRRLSHLRDIPVLIVATEASYHAAYDHCTAKYLTQAGVKNTFIRLEREGIHGNGHMVMLEKNNVVVAALLQKWISGHIR